MLTPRADGGLHVQVGVEMNRIAVAAAKRAARAPSIETNRRGVRGRRLFGVGLLAIALLGANSGEIDPTFGGDGWVFTLSKPYDRAGAMAVQPDGKIIVATTSGGFIASRRYLSSGLLDTTFGNDGVRTVPAGYAPAVVQDLALQPDGKIVLGGQIARKAMVARLMPDGSLDTSFGNGDGLATIVPAVHGTSLATVRILLFPDGGILAEVNRSGSFRSRSFLTRFSPVASTDPGFASAGRLPAGKGVPAISLGEAGILMARSDPASTHRVAVTRFSMNGRVDEGFGAGGTVSVSLGPDAYDASATAIATDDLGRIVVAASGYGSCSFDSTTVVRIMPDGRRDPDFAASSSCFHAVSLFPSADGSVIAVGSVFAGGGSGEYHVWLSKLRPDGLPDTAFGDEGRVIAAPEVDYWLLAQGADLQPDGKVVVLARASYQPAFLLARFDV